MDDVTSRDLYWSIGAVNEKVAFWAEARCDAFDLPVGQDDSDMASDGDK